VKRAPDRARGRAAAGLLAVIVAALAAGCVRTAAVHYYTLGGPPAPVARPSGATPARYTIRVAPASLPESLDRPEMVLRVSTTEVAIDDDHRWAEPLGGGIARAVARGLARELPDADVALGPAGEAPGAPDVEVTLDVQGLDARVGWGVALDVLWAARVTDGGALRSGRARASAPAARAGGHDALVAACSEALAAVSRQIAGGLRGAVAARGAQRERR